MRKFVRPAAGSLALAAVLGGCGGAAPSVEVGGAMPAAEVATASDQATREDAEAALRKALAGVARAGTVGIRAEATHVADRAVVRVAVVGTLDVANRRWTQQNVSTESPSGGAEIVTERAKMSGDEFGMYFQDSDWPAKWRGRWLATDVPGAYSTNSILSILENYFEPAEVDRPAVDGNRILLGTLPSWTAVGMLGLADEVVDSGIALASLTGRTVVRVDLDGSGLPSGFTILGKDVDTTSLPPDLRLTLDFADVIMRFEKFGERDEVDLPAESALLSAEDASLVMASLAEGVQRPA